MDPKPGSKMGEDVEIARKDCEDIKSGKNREGIHMTAGQEVLLGADENEDQNYEKFKCLSDKTCLFLGAGSFEMCDPLCDSELAAALHSFSSLSLGLSLETLASRRERLAARSTDILRGPHRLTAKSSEALQGSLRRTLCMEMRSSLPMLPRPCSPDRWEGISIKM